MTDDVSTSRTARIRRILKDRLPDEVILPVAWRRALMVILMAVLIVVAINQVTRWYLTRYPINRGYWLVQEKWKLLDSLSEPADWLILGDSSANQGVVPAVIEEQLGGEAVNLATNAGMTLVDDVWMLEEHIERFGPPENVLVVHTVDIWDRYVQNVMIAKIPRPWGFWRSSAIDPGLDADQWLDVFLARYVPLFGENKSIKSVVDRNLEAPEKMFQERFQLEPDGYMMKIQPNKGLTLKETDNLLGKFERRGFAFSTINESALKRMVDLADEYDFDLYLANGPLYDAVLEDEVAQAYFEYMTDGLETVAGRSDNVHYVPLLAGFPLDQMENADHVIHSAAELYSQMLASKIDRIQSNASPADRP